MVYVEANLSKQEERSDALFDSKTPNVPWFRITACRDLGQWIWGKNSAQGWQRVGRTGRFGSRGICVSFVTPSELTELNEYVEQAQGGEASDITERLLHTELASCHRLLRTELASCHRFLHTELASCHCLLHTKLVLVLAPCVPCVAACTTAGISFDQSAEHCCWSWMKALQGFNRKPAAQYSG
eukprot:scaffold113293_cov20-Tisochrysis_lutea.AAC.1